MSDLQFKQIGDELYRTYVFPCGSHVTITDPQELHVSASGGHRILDASGVSHYIPGRWVHLFWVVKEGCTPFKF